MRDRRNQVAFDPDHFARRIARGDSLTVEERFRHAYETNLWAGADSPSGPGASRSQTSDVRAALPPLCKEFGVKTLLDLPCGDCHWMTEVPLPGVSYIGADLLPELIAANENQYQSLNRSFMVLDLTRSVLPSADLILVRDCLVHLSFADASRAIDNVKRSNIRYLLTTTFTSEPVNRDVPTGDWRPLNLVEPPFGFPEPLYILNEGCTEQEGVFADKSLGLWKVADLGKARDG